LSEIPPFTVALGKAEYPKVKIAMEKIAGRVKKLIAFDANKLALQAGSTPVLNMVILCALAQTGSMTLNPDLFRQTIRKKPSTFI